MPLLNKENSLEFGSRHREGRKDGNEERIWFASVGKPVPNLARRCSNSMRMIVYCAMVMCHGGLLKVLESWYNRVSESFWHALGKKI